MQDQLLRANLCFFFSPKGSCAPTDAIRVRAHTIGQYSLGVADHSSDHGNYCISISLGRQRGCTYSWRPSFVPGTGAALPSFILQPWFEEANEQRPGTSILQAGSSHSSFGSSVKSHVFTKGQAYSQSVYTPLLCARSPRCGTQTVKARVPPFHTVPGSKGGWRGMWKRAVFV